MKKSTYSLILLALTILSIQSCKKDKSDPEADSQLFNEINKGGYTWYQNGDTLPGTSPSPHGNFTLRFNSVAQSVLDSTGELPVGASFPSGSILVKEAISGGVLSLHVVMKKDPSSSNSGSGWLWAEYSTDGSVSYGVASKGGACVSCHSTSPNRDLVKTFDLH